MLQLKSGTATTSAPSPSVQTTSSALQPTGTAQTNGMARRKPWLAASAVDSVVLGPGVKLIAVASTRSAVNSCQFMGSDFIVESSTPPIQLRVQMTKLYCPYWQHTAHRTLPFAPEVIPC